MNWISMEDQPPDENQRVWAYCPDTGVAAMIYHNLEGTENEIMGKHCFVGHGGWLTDDVTHWMELSWYKPKPPEDSNADTTGD
jgi:hypothetical protein